MTYNIHCTSKASFVFIGTLLSSAAWYVTPASADASLDELKARLERAEKENIVLKTEKVERENITMKLEKIEAENAALRNETKVDKTPTASIPTKKSFSTSSSSQEVKTVARREVIEANSSASGEHPTARKEINNALEKIPKDDAKREMIAAYKAPKEEVPVVVKQWQGIYAGISAGYGEAYVPYTTTMLGPAVGYFSGNITPTVFNTNQYPTLSSNNSSEALSGPVVGGQVGYNYQFSNRIVLGIETDLHYSDINNRYSPNSNYKFSQNNQNGIYTGSIYGNPSINWLGSTRLRLGYDLGKFLPYITGGFSYGDISINSVGTYTNAYTSGGQSGVSATSSSSVQTGWAAGAGAEYIVADNWSVKGEYLYTALNSMSANGTAVGNSSCCGGSSSSASGASTVNISMGTFGIHQARVGLNYHTNWLGGINSIPIR